jgi:type VI secretion system secreted protein Hcp
LPEISGCRIHVLKLPNHGGTVPADLYLSIPGLTDGPGTPQSGTTIDAVRYLQISSFSFGVAGPPGEPAAAGAGAGKVQFSPFSVALPVDFATPRLFQACAIGKVFPTATLLVRTAGGGPQITTQRYDFKQVAVQSLAVSASAQSDEQSVSFGYRALSISVTPVSAQGQAGQTVSGGFDLTQNKAV